MRKIITTLAITLFVSTVLFSPFLVTAGSSSIDSNKVATIQNPLKSDDVNKILLDVMNLVAKIGGVLVVLFIIYSGYKFVTAGESDQNRDKAKSIFYATVIGGAILLGADIIANIIIGTVKSTAGIK